MKILRILHIFALGASRELYRKLQISYRGKCYQEELEGNLKVKIDNCAALSREFKKIGFEVSDIYYDPESLQKKWAM